MSKHIFAKSGDVEIQGKYALNLISLNRSAVEFEVIGLTNPTVHFIDKRPEVKKKTKEMLREGDLKKLATYFNKPALIRILPSPKNTLLISLEKTRAKKFDHMLWVAVGLRGKIPYFEKYIRFHIEPLRENRFSLFYLFKKSNPKDTYTN